MNAGLYKYFLDQKFCINLSVYAILNKRRNLTTITNNNLSRIEENNKTPYEGGNLAASKIRNLECPNYEICLIDYGCGKFNRKIHIMEQYP